MTLFVESVTREIVELRKALVHARDCIASAPLAMTLDPEAARAKMKQEVDKINETLRWSNEQGAQ